MIQFKLDEKGYIKNRESFNLEYKENFQKGDNLLKYIKTLVGMANNKGGFIFFGVKDSPHIPIGMTNDRFAEIDPKDIDRVIREYFSPSLDWNMDTYEVKHRKLGFIEVKECDGKPVVCTKNKSEILREGAIYYRYRGQTKEIEYPELKRLLDKEKEKERTLWMQHISTIAQIGPQNVHLLDGVKGEMNVNDKKIIIDKNLIDKINFIKEGHFTDKEGEGLPTLKLIGSIEGADIEDKLVISQDDPSLLTTKELQDKLHLNSYEIQAILFAFNVKKNPKFHTQIKTGKSNIVHKYSPKLVDIFNRVLMKDNTLDDIKKKYEKYRKTKVRKNYKK